MQGHDERHTHLREFFRLRPLMAPSCDPMSAIAMEGCFVFARSVRAKEQLERADIIREGKHTKTPDRTQLDRSQR